MQKAEAENRNKISPQELVTELKRLLWGNNDNFALFFPEAYKKKIEDNFKLFDRDQDEYLNMEEVRTLLTSVDVDLSEEDVKTLYNELEEENKGVSINDFYLFIVKKKKDENKEAQLLECFQVIDKEGTGLIKDADDFKDLMMTKGLRMMEADVVQMMEVLNPKGKDEFEYKEFCKVVGAKEEGKKKKKKKGKKKKK